MTNSISKCNKTKTKPWKSSITKINTSKNWNKNALPRTLAFKVWRTKNTGFWGLKNQEHKLIIFWRTKVTDNRAIGNRQHQHHISLPPLSSSPYSLHNLANWPLAKPQATTQQPHSHCQTQDPSIPKSNTLWVNQNAKNHHTQSKIKISLLPISPPWNPKPQTKKTTKNQPNHLDSTQLLKRDLACCRLVSKTVNALTHEVP